MSQPIFYWLNVLAMSVRTGSIRTTGMIGKPFRTDLHRCVFGFFYIINIHLISDGILVNFVLKLLYYLVQVRVTVILISKRSTRQRRLILSTG